MVQILKIDFNVEKINYDFVTGNVDITSQNDSIICALSVG